MSAALDTPILFVATARPEAARDFYRDVLGLTLVADEPWALVFRSGDVMLRIQKAERVPEVPYTVLGWAVPDIGQAMAALRERGAEFVRYEHIPQDADGVWQTPDGARIAWLKDPDGNTLSLTQHA